MASLEVTEKAEEDADEVLQYTLLRWGEAKYWEYSDLIEEAYLTITTNPGKGRPRSRLRRHDSKMRVQRTQGRARRAPTPRAAAGCFAGAPIFRLVLAASNSRIAR